MPPQLNADEAKALMGNLDHSGAAQLPAAQYVVFVRAKRKLLDIEFWGRRQEQADAGDLSRFTRAA